LSANTIYSGPASEALLEREVADELWQDEVVGLLEIHDRAGPMQQSLLELYPDAPDALPMPFRDDLRYFDGAQFFMLHIAGALEEAGNESVLTEDELFLLNATNGLNDWWMDESGLGERGERDYDTVVEVFDGINAICYLHYNSEDGYASPYETTNPEVQRVVDFYDYVLWQMPKEYRASIAKLLISINLYQGITLYQEKGFRDHMGLEGLDFDGRNIGEDELRMLHRMRVEKGGFLFTYFLPFFPELADSIEIPDERLDIRDTIERFVDDGKSFYGKEGIGRRLLEIGGVLQLMDDSCDRNLDWDRGVVSPENVGAAYAARANESWGDMVDRILGELTALLRHEFDDGHAILVDAATNAVAGLTRYRANRYGSHAC
jgi:hypothetical protein